MGAVQENGNNHLPIAAKVFGMTFFAAILCFFLNMSVNVLVTGLFTDRVGMQYEEEYADGRKWLREIIDIKDEAGELTAQRITVYDIAGETSIQISEETVTVEQYEAEQKAASEAAKTATTTTLPSGETAAPDPTRLVNRTGTPINTPVAQGTQVFFDNLAQLLMLLLFIAFPYSVVWDIGNKDHNLVRFKRQEPNPRRGLVIGGLASIPAALMFALMAAVKTGGGMPGFVTLYRIFNICFLPYFNAVIPLGIETSADVPWSGIAAMLPILLALPVITHVAYFLGFKDISIREKLVYKTTGRHWKIRKRSQ